MKYLISSVMLGQLLEANDASRRRRIIEDVISFCYILGTSDNLTLDDNIKINKTRRKND